MFILTFRIYHLLQITHYLSRSFRLSFIWPLHSEVAHNLSYYVTAAAVHEEGPTHQPLHGYATPEESKST
jgi:hypothetical protein